MRAPRRRRAGLPRLADGETTLNGSDTKVEAMNYGEAIGCAYPSCVDCVRNAIELAARPA